VDSWPDPCFTLQVGSWLTASHKPAKGSRLWTPGVFGTSFLTRRKAERHEERRQQSLYSETTGSAFGVILSPWINGVPDAKGTALMEEVVDTPLPLLFYVGCKRGYPLISPTRAFPAGNWPESAWPWPTALVKYELGHLRLTSTSEKWNLEVLRFQSQWPSWLKDEQTSLDQGLTKSEIGYIDPKSDNWEEV